MNEQQKILLDIAKVFKDICEKNDIDYFMSGGTMLGAVRHKGFIPWDDDMDFQVPRKHYCKLKKLLLQQLPDNLYVSDMYTDSRVANPYIKIMSRELLAVEKFYPKNIKDMGLSIDIFPLDKCPKENFKKKIQAYRVKFLRLSLQRKRLYNFPNNVSYIHKLKYLIVDFLNLFTSDQKIVDKLEYELKRYQNITDNNCYVNMCGNYSYEKQIIEPEWLYNLKMYKFEHIQFKGISEKDSYLKRLYGSNYMKIPKERKSHHIFRENTKVEGIAE